MTEQPRKVWTGDRTYEIHTPTLSPGASGAGEVPLPDEAREWVAGLSADHWRRIDDIANRRAAHAAREARAEERARVVAWLRGRANAYRAARERRDINIGQMWHAGEEANRLSALADAIERGDHQWAK